MAPPSPPARRRRFPRPSHAALLALLLVALGASNVAWLLVDRHPTDMDQGRYMLMVHDFAASWRQPGVETLRSLWLGNHPTHPHLVPLAASIPFVLFGRNIDAAYFVNTLFYLGVVGGAYLLARRLADPAAGLLAAVLVAGLPLVARFSRFFLLEEATAFFVVATLYCLLRSEGFASTRWSALAGIAAGLGMLTKWTTLVFVAPPALVVAAVALARRPRGPALGRVLVLAAACAAVAAPWYLAHAAEVQDFLSKAEVSRLFAGEGPGLGQLHIYLLTLWATAGWPYTLLGAAGLAALVARPTNARLAILSSLLVPLAVFAFLLSTRDVRHLIPALPGLLVGSAVAIRSLPTRGLRAGATAAGAALALVSVAQGAWFPPGPNLRLHVGGTSFLVLPPPRPPDHRDWRFEELLAAAAEDDLPRRGAHPTPVRVLVGTLPFSTNGFAFLAADRFPTLRVVHVPFWVAAGNPAHPHLQVQGLVQPGYLIYREGDVNSNANGMWDYNRALRRLVEAELAAGGTSFELVHATTLPTGHAARVVRVSLTPCGRDMRDFLDWAYEIDRDDPGIAAIASGCARNGPPEEREEWEPIAAALALPAEDLERLAILEPLAAGRPDLRWPRRLLAESLAARGAPARAAALLDGLGGDPRLLCSPHLEAGELWRRAGDPPRALESLRQAAAETPDCVPAHRELAAALRAAGDQPAAEREERKAELLELQATQGPHIDSARFRLLLGDLAARAGETAEARHHYEAGRRNDPSDPSSAARLHAIGHGDGAPARRGVAASGPLSTNQR
jgi:hypothetical protein